MSLARTIEIILTPSPWVFVIGLLVIVLAPILVHSILVRSSQYASLPTVLLIGPSFAGKTALATVLERGPTLGPSPSRTSLTPLVIELTVSPGEGFEHAASETTTSAGLAHTKFLLVDLPGHPKLRDQVLSRLSPSTIDEQKIKGVVFVVNSATVGEEGALRETGEYLYTVLLALQRAAQTGLRRGRTASRVAVLVAANKVDLFTALPPSVVQTKLEAELSRIRDSRSKSLLDSSVHDEQKQNGEQDTWLGEYGSKSFSFAQMSESAVQVDVVGGSTVSSPGAHKWWTWISETVSP